MAENTSKKPGASVPRHIAIILDGNGRWAKKRGLPRTAGHAAGAETFRKIALYCRDIGVDYLTVYAFSTENWKRSDDEVGAIMRLLNKYLHEAIDTMERDGMKMRIFGDVSGLSPELQALAHRTDEIADRIDGFQANICLNYGGRDEIVQAARRYARDLAEGRAEGELTEEKFGSYLYSAGVPDPDLLIRPGGEQRISNFLLWQCAYAEFYFTDVLWPDFTPEELDKAIAVYQSRDRRYGGVKKGAMREIPGPAVRPAGREERRFRGQAHSQIRRGPSWGPHAGLRRAWQGAEREHGRGRLSGGAAALVLEENGLHAFFSSRSGTLTTCLAEVERFLPYVDNWATCDSLSPALLQSTGRSCWTAIPGWLASAALHRPLRRGDADGAFSGRGFRPGLPGRVADIRSEEYYVRMMRAWYFATALAKQYEAALPFLQAGRLDPWTHHKAIQKAVESYRVPAEHKKAELKTKILK